MTSQKNCNFITLDEFADYVKKQQEMGRFWTVKILSISKEKQWIIYARNNTKVVFDVGSRELISYNDGEYIIENAV